MFRIDHIVQSEIITHLVCLCAVILVSDPADGMQVGIQSVCCQTGQQIDLVTVCRCNQKIGSTYACLFQCFHRCCISLYTDHIIHLHGFFQNIGIPVYNSDLMSFIYQLADQR